MDIFEIAQQGMKAQEEEKKLQEQEEEKEDTKKKYKLNMMDVMKKAIAKEYDWYGNLSEDEQKAFSPFILNMWMAMISPNKYKVNQTKKVTDLDKALFDITISTNEILNKNIFGGGNDKGLIWLLSCSISQYDIDDSLLGVDFKKVSKNKKSSKVDPRVWDYLVQELWCSKDKIMDMVDKELITSDQLKKLQKDFETLDKPKKK